MLRKGPHCKISAVKLDLSIASHPIVEHFTGEAILRSLQAKTGVWTLGLRVKYNPQKYCSNREKFNDLEDQTHEIQWRKTAPQKNLCILTQLDQKLLTGPLRHSDYYFAMSREMLGHTNIFFFKERYSQHARRLLRQTTVLFQPQWAIEALLAWKREGVSMKSWSP